MEILAVLHEFYDRLGPLTPVLLALIWLDVLTGIVSAWVNKRMSSKISRAGMGRKVLELAIVVVAQVLEGVTGIPALSDIAAGFYIVTEALSVIENAAEAGVPVPEQLRAVLATLREKAAVPGVPVQPVTPVAPAVPVALAPGEASGEADASATGGAR